MLVYARREIENVTACARYLIGESAVLQMPVRLVAAQTMNAFPFSCRRRGEHFIFKAIKLKLMHAYGDTYPFAPIFPERTHEHPTRKWEEKKFPFLFHWIVFLVKSIWNMWWNKPLLLVFLLLAGAVDAADAAAIAVAVVVFVVAFVYRQQTSFVCNCTCFNRKIKNENRFMEKPLKNLDHLRPKPTIKFIYSNSIVVARLVGRVACCWSVNWQWRSRKFDLGSRETGESIDR